MVKDVWGGGANMNTCIVIYNNPSFVGMHSRTFLSNRISINLRSRHYISHYNRCDHAAVNPVNFIVTISGIPKRSHFITNAAITKIVKMLFQIGILCARYSVPVWTPELLVFIISMTLLCPHMFNVNIFFYCQYFFNSVIRAKKKSWAIWWQQSLFR